MTLTYTSYAESEPVSYLHIVDVVETAGSVAVFPRLEYLRGGWRHESLAAEQRTVTIVLSRPLGGRVLVDRHVGPLW